MHTPVSKAMVVIKDVVVPLIIAGLPFLTPAYDAWTQPDTYFVWDSTYKKNPVIEWNREVGKFLKHIEESTDGKQNVEPPRYLLRRIGKEVYDALPVMASGIGYKPFDAMTVRIGNLTQSELRNIRVSFIGCKELNSFTTYPDPYGDPEGELKKLIGKDSVTIRYDRIPPSPEKVVNLAYVIFYGADASECKPTVSVETSKGQIAVGKRENVDTYITDRAWERYRKEKRDNIIFKICIALFFLYLFAQIRSLKKRQEQST